MKDTLIEDLQKVRDSTFRNDPRIHKMLAQIVTKYNAGGYKLENMKDEEVSTRKP